MRQTCEGVKSCRPILELAAPHGVDMPITEAVVQAVHEGLAAAGDGARADDPRREGRAGQRLTAADGSSASSRAAAQVGPQVRRRPRSRPTAAPAPRSRPGSRTASAAGAPGSTRRRPGSSRGSTAVRPRRAGRRPPARRLSSIGQHRARARVADRRDGGVGAAAGRPARARWSAPGRRAARACAARAGRARPPSARGSRRAAGGARPAGGSSASSRPHDDAQLHVGVAGDQLGARCARRGRRPPRAAAAGAGSRTCCRRRPARPPRARAATSAGRSATSRRGLVGDSSQTRSAPGGRGHDRRGVGDVDGAQLRPARVDRARASWLSVPEYALSGADDGGALRQQRQHRRHGRQAGREGQRPAALEVADRLLERGPGRVAVAAVLDLAAGDVRGGERDRLAERRVRRRRSGRPATTARVAGARRRGSGRSAVAAA